MDKWKDESKEVEYLESFERNPQGSPLLIYLTRIEDFTFLGNYNVVDEASDFGQIWGRFFDKGGYDPIIPYSLDQSPVNVWFTNAEGQQVYFQGLFVKGVDQVPEGYCLMDFPGGEYLVVTTEWMESNEDAVGPKGNGRCNGYADYAPVPEGYVRDESYIIRLEVERANMPQGSRYEVWVPIRRIENGA